MRAGTCKIFLSMNLTSTRPSKIKFWTPNLIFHLLQPPKFMFLSISPFWDPRFETLFVEHVPMDHTDHFDFSRKVILIQVPTKTGIPCFRNKNNYCLSLSGNASIFVEVSFPKTRFRLLKGNCRLDALVSWQWWR